MREHPGIHFRALARAAGLTSLGQLRHHIDHLRRDGRVVEVEDGRFRRLFAAGQHEPTLRLGLARTARPVPRRICRLLLAQPRGRSELQRLVGCAESTLGYHLRRMMAAGDVERSWDGRRRLYTLADAELVRRTLAARQAASLAPSGSGEPVVA